MCKERKTIEIGHVCMLVNTDFSRRRYNAQLQISLIQWAVLCNFIRQTKQTHENIEFDMYRRSENYWPTSTSSVYFFYSIRTTLANVHILL